ncbi:hypothetical protein MTO96_025172 [Rhipicephalus appendiculatus]
MSSVPSSPHGSGSESPNSRSGDDVVYAAHFDFDPIATSSSDEESVDDGANADDNDLGVVVDVADGLPQWRCRNTAYILFARWIWHKLGRYNRKPLPSCVVLKIRKTFPSEHYTGFCYVDY